MAYKDKKELAERIRQREAAAELLPAGELKIKVLLEIQKLRLELKRLRDDHKPRA